MPPYFQQEGNQLVLFFPGERAHDVPDLLKVWREYLFEQCARRSGEGDEPGPTIGGIETTFDQPSMLQTIEQLADSCARHAECVGKLGGC